MKNALGNHGSPTGEVYGTGALMTAYIGYLASGSAAPDGTITLGETGNAAKIISGIDKIFNEIINNHKSLEDAIYATTGKTESELMGHFSGSNSNDNFVNFLINVAQEAGVDGSGSVVNGLGSSINIPSYYNEYTGTHFIVDNVNTTSFGTVGGDVTLQIGASASETITIFRFDMSTEGLGLGDTNVLTRSNANQAIETLRSAVNYTSLTRAYFGAKQNRLEHTINSLKISNENVTSAESRIRDTDMAKEITKYTKNNILLQASQSMLAQANQTPQGVLALLG
ncbi:hypothetical protein BXO88_10510 [Oribacterium sp. C9]|uniref:flagellin n=1 Tax=Oribacterium sp. C9 TaxID=1943579 RepID=UPI00098F86F5|nr:flagellin [Oribacterium sp. C9]OON85860.1 hypothetical protein BXO88_10510 [Oribacterium sp. C9]